jgi:hypothetical protein
MTLLHSYYFVGTQGSILLFTTTLAMVAGCVYVKDQSMKCCFKKRIHRSVVHAMILRSRMTMDTLQNLFAPRIQHFKLANKHLLVITLGIIRYGFVVVVVVGQFE